MKRTKKVVGLDREGFEPRLPNVAPGMVVPTAVYVQVDHRSSDLGGWGPNSDPGAQAI
ncbi:hypothetical protein V5E97_28770 [Singulisphaera sp. Ch08]|uniref:Uncharacterized protein n=1 Tax=Singulisphaera sp. Ch08 TaxID=3120278 RepID=A0AAU7CB21_9BACT